MRINDKLTARAVAHMADMPGVASPMPGVERRMLERQGVDGARRATSIVRYALGSRFSPHVHRAGEEFLVLAGTFSDELGDYPAGAYVRNPPGSRHAPFSVGGTTIFVQLQQFAADDLVSGGHRHARVSMCSWHQDLPPDRWQQATGRKCGQSHRAA